MMSYQEINEFLTSFNINSYNRTQIGNSRQLIITIYEFLSKLNINKSNIIVLSAFLLDKTGNVLYNK